VLARLVVTVLAGVLLAAPAMANEPGRVESCARGGDLALCHAVVAPAPASEVWRLWTTSEGLSSWAAPVAAIELRVGGTWEASYDRGARIGDSGNIRNRVVAFAPERLLVIQIADAPPGFPHEELARQLATTIELEPLDASRTLVRVSMMGYRDEPGFDVLRGHFDRGNAWTLSKLYERVVSGPVDWNAVLTQ
jgi:uncharacterized protein YndB with AHSA1/START domain